MAFSIMQLFFCSETCLKVLFCASSIGPRSNPAVPPLKFLWSTTGTFSLSLFSLLVFPFEAWGVAPKPVPLLGQRTYQGCSRRIYPYVLSQEAPIGRFLPRKHNNNDKVSNGCAHESLSSHHGPISDSRCRVTAASRTFPVYLAQGKILHYPKISLKRLSINHHLAAKQEPHFFLVSSLTHVAPLTEVPLRHPRLVVVFGVSHNRAPECCPSRISV